MYQFFKQLVLPPLGPLLFMALGGLLRRRRRWRAVGSLALVLGGVMLYLTSAPYFSTRLLAAAESGVAPLDLAALPPGPGAIVVLGAGLDTNAVEYGGATVDDMALSRLRYGAALHRATVLPVLVSGGTMNSGFESLSRYMARVLSEDYAVRDVWQEDQSLNTAQNAAMSANILRARGVDTVFLVSHAWHLRRAAAAFSRAGIAVVPAPTGFVEVADLKPLHLLPTPRGIQVGYLAIHEVLGALWYKLRAAF